MTAAQIGHQVTVFEQSDKIGGQLNMAKQVPGKEEFWGLVDWFNAMIDELGITVHLGHAATVTDLQGFDDVIVATGVHPRDPQIPAQNRPNVCHYTDILQGRVTAGKQVVVVGAGGIGFDVSEFLVHDAPATAQTPDLDHWRAEWGVGDPAQDRGGLAATGPAPTPAARSVTLLQRKPERPGKRLGKTTGWIHRSTLAMKNVQMAGGVNYEKIDDQGLHVTHGPDHVDAKVYPADTIILCTGQVSNRTLADQLVDAGIHPIIIGGADVAGELDAKRAIDQGLRVALGLAQAG
jgi:2,4-dienoyl-CoA reductase (NADPH2)